MTHSSGTVGTVRSLWRYPVKSMMGEELATAEVRTNGLVGDRLYALLDQASGKVASAKNPRMWPNLFAFRASLSTLHDRDEAIRPVCITLPDGATVTSEQADIDQILSNLLGRQVVLAVTDRGRFAAVQGRMPDNWVAKAEEYWPDMEGRQRRDTVTDFTMPTGTFFDGAIIHVVTTATLNRLRTSYPTGRFEVPRFHPNIVVDLNGGATEFVEQTWKEKTLAIGEDLRLRVTGPCGRCVMTTLAQEDLPHDPGILRTAVQLTGGEVGIYATVIREGAVKGGDGVRLDA